jgi:hypothetical protein
MKAKHIFLIALFQIGASYPLTLHAQANENTASDEAGIRLAILDYAESAYEVEPERVGRSVHPSLRKIGYWKRSESDPYVEATMTYEELRELASRWNKDGRVDPEMARKDITIFDILDKTATAKLEAEWGIDYFHLAKLDGKWMIMNVMWQTYPK